MRIAKAIAASWTTAALVLAVVGCGDPALRDAVENAAGPATRQVSAAATATPGAGNHEIYAANAIACADCHPCGVRSPDGHAQPWMDASSPEFHAVSANQGLSSCQTCHGPNLDGVDGITVVSCAQCHGATWKTDCTMCHGGGDSATATTGAPPKATWGNAGDTVRIGAHTAHVGAAHGLSQPVACAACHLLPADALSPGHLDGTTATVTFAGLAALGVPAPGPTWDRAQATCGATYCHGETLAGGTLKAPLWTAADGAARACDACHGLPPPAPHVQSAACGDCHAGYAAGVANAATHVDGKLDVVALTCSSCHGSATSAAPPRGTAGQGLTTDRAVGAHQRHLSGGAIAGPVACAQCHVVPGSMNHADGAVVLVFGALAGGPQASFDPATLTCSTYCHGVTLAAGGANVAPIWTRVDGTQAACGTCHGAPPPPPHVASADCGRCHAGYTATAVNLATHVDGTLDVLPLTCSSCHGSSANAAPPAGLSGETATTTRAVGAHQRHLQASVFSNPIACSECHAVPALMNHSDGAVQLTFGPLAGGVQASYDPATLTCSTYCHGAFPGGNAVNAPVWNRVDGTQAACGTCHGTPASPAPPAPGHTTNPDCGVCHAGYTAGVVNLATHLNGLVDVTASSCDACHGSAANPAPPLGTGGETLESQRAVGAHQRHLSGGPLRGPMDCTECHVLPTAFDHFDGVVQLSFGPLAQTDLAPATFDPVNLTCANYCHGITLRGGGTNLNPTWTGGAAETTCGSCHGRPPPQPHPHTQICDNCHPGYTIDTVNLATHVNGIVEAENLTCSSCHGDDTRVLVSQADPLAVAAPPYGSRGETDPTSRSVGQHPAHTSRGDGIALPNKCRYCHAVPTTFDHADGVSQVTFGSLATMDGATPAFDGNTCSSTYCHGSTLGRGGTDHSPTWTNPAAVTCGSCHGVPPPAPHPQDSDCIRCHPGYTSTSVRKWTHVNGISDFPTGCNSCHDMPPNSGEHYEHLHERVSCDRCHAGYTLTTENPTLHRNARQDVTLSGWNPATRTCSSIGCHGSEYWGRTGTAARQSCNQCHGVPPRSGEHEEHREYSCSRCHGTGYSTTTTNGATHMSGTVDVPYAFYDRATRTCSSTGCHSREYWGTPQPVTPNCSNCHGFPPPFPHPQDAACQSCHPSMQSTGVLTTDHNNGTLDIAGTGCATCHGFPPVSTRTGGLHPADANCYGCHSTTVDAQNQVLPNGSHNDGYVQVGGGGIGTYGCQSCHGDQARQAPAGADPNVKSAPPLGTRGETEPTTRAVGAHLAHVSPSAGTLAGPARCDECHAVPAAMDHATGVVDVVLGGRAVLGGAAAAYDPASGSCSSTYCHGATLGAGGTSHAPVWTGGAAEAACGTCHGAPPPEPHSQNANCGGCHEGYGPGTVNLATHVDGTVQISAMACNSCHGSAANAAPPFGTRGESLTSELAVGAHQTHLAGGASAGPIACGECHVEPSSMDHRDGTAQVIFGALATTAGATPTWDHATATCSATYCHGATLPGGTFTAPVWTTVDGSQAGCGACHGAPPPPPHSTSTSCGTCHAGYTATSVNLATHLNGQIEGSPHDAGWADPAQHGRQVNLTGLSACTSCHALTGPSSSCTSCHAASGFAAWDTTCTFCHGSPSTGRASPPVDIQGRSLASNVSVGVHQAHVTTTIATPLACAECHPARSGSVTADPAHVDGNGIAEVALGALARTGGAAATYTRSSATSATCSSTYCHGRFSGGANSGSGATMSWTSTSQVGCTSCHGNPPWTGQHSRHVSRSVRCYNCHNSVASSSGTIAGPALHVDGKDDVRFGGTYNSRSVSGTWSASTRTCSSLSCHGTERW